MTEDEAFFYWIVTMFSSYLACGIWYLILNYLTNKRIAKRKQNEKTVKK